MQRRTSLLPALTLPLALIVLAILLPDGPHSGSGQAQAAPGATASATPTCLPAWTVVPSANAGTGGNSLQGLAAVSPTNLWAVGSYYVPSLHVDQTLIEHWDGASWTVVPSPNAGSSANVLDAVAAVSATDIWAVGYTGIDPNMVTLTEHWDGTNWSVVPSPNPGPAQNRLRGVAAVGPADIWAVGDAGVSLEAQQTVILHWNGSQWQPSPSPNPLAAANGLFGITARSAGDIWAVGFTCCLPHGANASLTEHWDGTSWSVIPSAPPAGNNDILEGVVALASTDVWAVGESLIGPQSRILHWDGARWNPVAGPNPGSLRNSLVAVTALAPDDIWAAGYTIGPSDEATTLVVHWDGSAWTQAPSPSIGPFFNELAAIVGVGPQDVWAAGHTDTFQAVNPTETLVEHYAGACAPPPTGTPAPSPTITPNLMPTPPPPATATPPPSPTATPPPAATATPLPPTATIPLVPSVTPLPPTATPPPAATVTPLPVTATPTTAPATPVPPTSSPPSPTPCTLHFGDVQPADYFAVPVTYLACHGVISGYADGTFRPYNQTTRAQMVKIVVLGFQKPITTPPDGAATFADVPLTFPFFAVIETAAAAHIVSGYACGGPGEACDELGRPYFRPAANVTRGQLAKIDVTAAGWPVQTPAQPAFADVAPGSAFYGFVETAVCHGVISGYADGTFRPGLPATRGQIAKIVYLSLTGSGACGAR